MVKTDFPELLNLGVYISPPGGSTTPLEIPAGTMYFEMLMDGAVYDFAPEPQLHTVGTVFVHHPGHMTISRTEGDGTYSCFFIACSYTEQCPSKDWPRWFSWQDAASARKFADEMVRAYHDGSIDKVTINNLIWSQFSFRLEQFIKKAGEDHFPDTVARTIAFIDKQYADPLMVESLAENVSISASHLQAIFRQSVGQSIHQYLIQVRMNAAVHRLVTTNDPIKAVAREVGYANTENFCRAFKVRFGLTAAAYRMKYRNYHFLT